MPINWPSTESPPCHVVVGGTRVDTMTAGTLVRHWDDISNRDRLTTYSAAWGTSDDIVPRFATINGRPSVYNRNVHSYLAGKGYFGLWTGIALAFTYDPTAAQAANNHLVQAAYPCFLTITGGVLYNRADNGSQNAYFSLPPQGSLTVIITQWVQTGPTSRLCRTVLDDGTMSKSPTIEGPMPTEYLNTGLVVGGIRAEFLPNIYWHEIRFMKSNNLTKRSDQDLIKEQQAMKAKWTALTS